VDLRKRKLTGYGGNYIKRSFIICNLRLILLELLKKNEDYVGEICTKQREKEKFTEHFDTKI
jgi:hypothetical protein